MPYRPKGKKNESSKRGNSSLNPSALIADGLDEAILGYGQQFPKEPVLIMIMISVLKYLWNKVCRMKMRLSGWNLML